METQHVCGCLRACGYMGLGLNVGCILVFYCSVKCLHCLFVVYLFVHPCCTNTTYYRITWHFTTLVAQCCLEATNQYLFWGGRVSNFMIDILLVTLKLPQNREKYFFPPKSKSHAVEG